MIDAQVITAQDRHFDSCYRFDQFNKQEVLREKINRNLVYIAVLDNKVVGYFRWDMFWNRIPYLCLIKVDKKSRSKGIGTKLLSTWQEELKTSGYTFCLSSSQVNEPEAVDWHFKRGFKEIGRLETLNADGSTEIFLRKELA